MAERRNDLTEYDVQLEEGQIETIERLRVLWENTDNPVYVWKAISHCFAIGMIRERGRTGQIPTPPWTDPYPFPDWCNGYLSIVSARINALSDGIDYRLYPCPIGEAEATKQAHETAARQKLRALPGKRAVSLLPSALGLVEGGANAFDRAVSLQDKELDALAFETLKDIHGSSKEAMDALVREAGIENERSMRKRLTEADRANGIGTKKRFKSHP